MAASKITQGPFRHRTDTETTIDNERKRRSGITGNRSQPANPVPKRSERKFPK